MAGVVAAAVILALVWGLQRRLIFFPGSAEVPPAAAVLAGAQDVTVRTADGLDLAAWFVPAGPPDAGVTVLVAHGNAGDRAGRAPLARALAARGLSVLLLDYRGYGGNPGTPDEQGLALDVRAAREYLVTGRDVPPDRLLYFGESLGAAVAAELAVEHPPAGLVLRSPFESLAAMARTHYPLVPAFLLRDEFDVAGSVAQVPAPTVVVYGTSDTIVPPAQSRAVARAAARLHAEVAVEGADHNDPALLAGDELVTAVVDLAQHVRGDGG